MPQLTHEQLDLLQEMIHIGVGRAASMLNDMLDKHVELSVPTLILCTPQTLPQEVHELTNGNSLSVVRLNFRGGLTGSASIMFTTDNAHKLVNVLTDGEADDSNFNSLKIGTLNEVGNIVINAVMGTISNMLTLHLNYSLPSYTENHAKQMFKFDGNDPDMPIILARAQFVVEALHIQGAIYIMFAASTFGHLLAQVDAILEE